MRKLRSQNGEAQDRVDWKRNGRPDAKIEVRSAKCDLGNEQQRETREGRREKREERRGRREERIEQRDERRCEFERRREKK